MVNNNVETRRKYIDTKTSLLHNRNRAEWFDPRTDCQKQVAMRKRIIFLSRICGRLSRAPSLREHRVCPHATSRALHCAVFLLSTALALSQTNRPPLLVVNPISIVLDSSGTHTLTSSEIAAITAGSSDDAGIANISITPQTFNFCDVGTRTVNVRITNILGDSATGSGSIRVLAPGEPPHFVYVDANYPQACGEVGFPAGTPLSSHWIGFDAFSTVQAAVDHVAPHGAVFVAGGTYVENVVVSKPLFLIGPNAGVPGDAAGRKAEARVVPAKSDPENAPIISLESDEIVIDGLCLDGSNPALAGGYDANGTRVHAAAGIQNGTYPDLADVERITVRNNVLTNISYDGICLDRYQYFGTSSAWNFIRNNKLANMWEGVLTYGVDSVISGNVISNVTHGLSVHCVTTPAPRFFYPLVASNILHIAQWWPVEIQPARAPGIWINYRREAASPIDVIGNVVNTPVQAPALKTIIGLYALTTDGTGTIRFTDNTVNGAGNCTIGFLAANCWSNGSVTVCGGAFKGIERSGVQLDTLDSKWGPGDSCVTVSNVDIEMRSGGVGVLALQQPATPANRTVARVIGNTSIHGGACGVQVVGANSAASIVGKGQALCGNDVGVFVNAGRALLEGNVLTNNRVAAMIIENNGLVDAGDCDGLNATGLGSGSGPNGASAGLNELSGYGFDLVEPWAIINSGTNLVSADNNFFGVRPGEVIDDAIRGPVRFSDSGVLKITPPPLLRVECLGQVPAAARTLEEFIAAGGSVLSGSASSISCQERIVTNRPGSYTFTRTYTLWGGCAAAVSCDHVITARDDRGPVLQCSDGIVQGVDPGCDYATVTFTNLAADACGELLGDWVPVTTGKFPPGTNRLIVIATDAANNTSSCSFDIAVVPLPVITLQPISCTNNAGTTASFKVTATSVGPMKFQWTRNGARLSDGGNISEALGPELTVAAVSESDASDYRVEISNLAGTAVSSPAHLTVISPPGNLRILGVSQGIVMLEVTGPAGKRFGILTSTNLHDWIGLQTNVAPFLLSHTNAPGLASRFYRARQAP